MNEFVLVNWSFSKLIQLKTNKKRTFTRQNRRISAHHTNPHDLCDKPQETKDFQAKSKQTLMSDTMSRFLRWCWAHPDIRNVPFKNWIKVQPLWPTTADHVMHCVHKKQSSPEERNPFSAVPAPPFRSVLLAFFRLISFQVQIPSFPNTKKILCKKKCNLFLGNNSSEGCMVIKQRRLQSASQRRKSRKRPLLCQTNPRMKTL